LFGLFWKRGTDIAAILTLAFGIMLAFARLFLDFYLIEIELEGALAIIFQCNFLHFGVFLFLACSFMFVVVSLCSTQREDLWALDHITWNWQQTQQTLLDALESIRQKNPFQTKRGSIISEPDRLKPERRDSGLKQAKQEQDELEGKNNKEKNKDTEQKKAIENMENNNTKENDANKEKINTRIPTDTETASLTKNVEDNEGNDVRYNSYGSIHKSSTFDDFDWHTEHVSATSVKQAHLADLRFHRYNWVAALILLGTISVLIVVFR
jgi:hypothetical protein